LLTAAPDGRLIVWDARRAVALETLSAGGVGPMRDLQISPDGATAYGAGRDGKVVVWDLTGRRRWERPFAGDVTPVGKHALVSSADGNHAAVVDSRGFVELFGGPPLRPAARIRPAHGRAEGAALSPDGGTLVLTTYDGVDGTVEFWNTRARRRLGAPQVGHAAPADVVRWSADGRWVATGDPGSAVRLWDARRRRPRAVANVGVTDLSLSPDGRLLAATLALSNFAGGLEIRSVPDLEVVRTVRVPLGAAGRFSPDGRSFVYGDRDGRMWILDTRTWRPRGEPLDVTAPVLSAELSPDGRLLAAPSEGGTGRLWDVIAPRPVGAGLSGGPQDPVGAAFVDGGSRLAVVHQRGGVAWDVRPGSWTRHACAVAGRRLTRSEWRAVLPRHPYAPACG